MLRPKKKISRKELKEDALITTYVKATTFYEQNKKNISIGITLVAVLIIASVVYLRNRSESNERAMTQLGQIYSFFDNGQYQIAIDGIAERNIAGLKSIVENEGSSSSGDLARFYLANCYFHLGKYDEALKYFEDFSPTDELLVVSRLSGIASCYEATGRHREAGEWFEKAATKYAGDGNAPENLNSAARNYGQAGEKEKAIDLYRKLKKNFPASVYAREADRFIAQLTV